MRSARRNETISYTPGATIKPAWESRWLNNVLWEVITVLTIYIYYECIFSAASTALPNPLTGAIR